MHTSAERKPATEHPFALFCGEKGALWVSTCVASAVKLEPVIVEGLASLRGAIARPGVRFAVIDVDTLGTHGVSMVERLATHGRVLVLTSAGPAIGAAAVDAGAVDVLVKPADPTDQAWLARLAGAVRALSLAPHPKPLAAPEVVKSPAATGVSSKVVLIGCGLGGYGQLARVLAQLPRTAPGVVVVYHTAEGMGVHVADRLRARTELSVRMLRDGDAIHPGTVCVAPQGFHTALRTTGSSYTARVFHGPSVTGCLPSANVLLDSSARYAGLNAIGVLLDSDSDDGARGLLALRQAGGRTICVSPESGVFTSAVRAASEIHAVQAAVSIDAVAAQIMRFARGAALVA